MTDHTTDALASALPAGISYEVDDHFAMWNTREIAEHQVRQLADSGYVLIHPETLAQDEAEVERIAIRMAYGTIRTDWSERMGETHRDYWRELARQAIGAMKGGDR